MARKEISMPKYQSLSDEENMEYDILVEFQSNRMRWFSQEEFDRLRYLNMKIFQFWKSSELIERTNQ